MTINKSKGNMYSDTDTWNCMYGICSHNCLYCYNRRWWGKWGQMRFNEKALTENLGSGNFYFVGSSCDMFADDIPKEWIIRALVNCCCFTKNRYLFQSKNPKRFKEFYSVFPPDTILGTTIETNRENDLGNAPPRGVRLSWMVDIPKPRMVSIEPIMDFDLADMKRWIFAIKPEFVYIGANTNDKVKLPEPSKEKIEMLIKELKEITEVRVKKNLARLTSHNSRFSKSGRLPKT